jgi:2,3-bisphosphoglycerate-dependent phosphoglycerate mutase
LVDPFKQFPSRLEIKGFKMTAKLILMRHGRSTWNAQNLFTGWVDIPLDEKGIQEALKGGEKLRECPIDVIFTSTLIRAQMTVVLALLHHTSKKVPVFLHPRQGHLDTWAKIHSEETKKNTIPVHIAAELNERMYGKLQGMNKIEMAEKFGADQVQKWRRSFDIQPPEGESLKDTCARAWPYFQNKIIPHLDRKETVFIAAHGNSLRAIVMHIERLSNEAVVQLEIATGEPLLYTYDKGTWEKE